MRSTIDIGKPQPAFRVLYNYKDHRNGVGQIIIHVNADNPELARAMADHQVDLAKFEFAKIVGPGETL